MGAVVDVVGGVFGDSTADKAADAQIDSSRQALELQRESRDIARSDLQPTRELGVEALSANESAPSLAMLASNPTAQREYLQENPFYQGLRQDAFRDVTANNAALGKLGSGGTLEELQNRYLSLGRNLISQDVAERTNLATLGANAAAGQATATQNAAGAMSDLFTQQGNVRAAEYTAKYDNAMNTVNSIGNTVSQGANILASLSDRRAKEDIEAIGVLDNGLRVYRYRYKGDDIPQIGVIAQEVEQVMPHAVIEKDGVKYVNYGAL